MDPKDIKYVPQSCVFEATLACNLNCKHCGSSAGKARSDELSTTEAADLFLQLAKLGCKKITISGGEPTMRDDWPDLIEAADRAGLHTGMITNAVKFDYESAVLAKKKGLCTVGFSVDGVGACHDRIRGKVGHYNHLHNAMENARKAELPFAAVSFVNRYNLSSLGQIYDMLIKNGAFAWQVQLGTDMGNMSENRDLLMSPRELPRMQAVLAGLVKRNKLRIDISDSIGYHGPYERLLRSSIYQGRKVRQFKGCPAGKSVIGIESNGNVKGCLSIMAGYNKQGADFVEGNIRDRSLAEIWNDSNAFSYNRNWNIENLAGFCRDCHHAEDCRGGCRAKMTASGDGEQNPMCVHRVLSEDAIGRKKTGVMAAAVLASAIGGVAPGCDIYVSEYGVPNPHVEDSDTQTETSQTDDTETVDTTVDEYGLPDTTVDEYGLPD